MITDLTQTLSGGMESRHAEELHQPLSDCELASHDRSGSCAPPAQNILPVERDSSGRALKQPQPQCETHAKGERFVRGGQKHLKADLRTRQRELNSRVRILRKALTETQSSACFDLYWKAILCAEFDIQELLA